jgi:hypothetical protein
VIVVWTVYIQILSVPKKGANAVVFGYYKIRIVVVGKRIGRFQWFPIAAGAYIASIAGFSNTGKTYIKIKFKITIPP